MRPHSRAYCTDCKVYRPIILCTIIRQFITCSASEISKMLGIFVLINILHASKSYPYRRYHYVPTQPPWHHLYRQPNLFQQIPMQNYGFHGAPGGSMRSHTTEVDTEGERDIQDFLKQYVYVLLLAKLFSGEIANH